MKRMAADVNAQFIFAIKALERFSLSPRPAALWWPQSTHSTCAALMLYGLSMDLWAQGGRGYYPSVNIAQYGVDWGGERKALLATAAHISSVDVRLLGARAINPFPCNVERMGGNLPPCSCSS
jgi:hypothetical protein